MLDKDVNEYFDIIASSLREDIVCIVEIDSANHMYNVRKSDEHLDKVIKKQGSLRELYCMLFSSADLDPNEENNYGRFIDEEVFKKDKYHGRVYFDYDGTEKSYYFRFVTISEESSIIVFFDFWSERSNLLEIEKLDTIQESYLFSMIVDLSNDSCVNPNTTETKASRQDYMEINYSKWRLMISNMFKDEDKVLFLRASAPENVINTLELQNSFHLDLQMLNMKGKFIWSRLNFTRMKGFSREKPRFVYTVSDISEDIARLIKQEGIIKAIEEQNERLVEADKNKSRFVSNMSHEIRTPINTIVGMNEVILRDCTDETIRNYAKDVKAASQYLLSIVNDILDYSKIEAGKMEIVPVEYNVRDMINSASSLVRPRIAEKPVEFEINIDDELPNRLFGDDLRISQVLVNLLTNAIKYTDEGKVTFSVEKVAEENGKADIRFTVKDTGIGIKQEDMGVFFEEYGRLDLEKNRKKEGTGLGMSIILGLLDQMKSKLVVDSVYGQGTTFSFVISQKIVTESEEVEKWADAAEKSLAEISGMEILVVDDNIINLHIFESLMEPYMAEVDMVQSGREALEKIQDKEYDIIFLDHVMDGMDGVETLQHIRKYSDYYSKAPVIALTGHYSPTARAEYISVGFTDYLEKPILLDSLNRILEMY